MNRVRPLSALILGAGLSVRFGGDKLSADFGGRPLVMHVVNTIRKSLHAANVIDIKLVAPPGFALPMPADVAVVTAPDHAKGISHSLRTGLESLSRSSEAVFVFLADMPFAPSPELLGELVEHLPMGGSIRPAWRGKPGHPVLICRSLWHGIIELQGDRGAQAVLAGAPSLQIEAGNEHVIFDIDTPEDLQEAKRFLN